VRRLLSIAMVLLVSAFLVSNSYAAQDRSFTNINSAGMFEDVYDFFKLSPAYLSSFEKTTLWTQLSNLYDTGDDLFDDTGNSYLLLGGQTDLMGLGRIGVMVDWYSQITPKSVQDANGFPSPSSTGHASSTKIDYLDTNSDSIIDNKIVSTAEIEKYDNFMNKEIYAAYGMGGFMGFDVGVSIRADLSGYSPSWNDWNGDVSLNEKYESRTTNLLSNTDTSLTTYERSGKLEYGESTYELAVGARSKKLISNLDLVANLGFILNPVSNDYEYTYEQTIDADLSNPDTKIYNKTSEIGIEPDATDPATEEESYYPGTGMGGLAEVRGDYQLTSNIVVIGEAAFGYVGRGVTDEEQKRESIDRKVTMPGLDIYTDETANSTTDTYEGDVTDMAAGVSLRAIYQGEGWRLGMGLRAGTNSTVSEITTTSETNNVVTVAGRATPSANSVATTTSSLTSITKSRSVYNAIEIPVGLQIDILKNLPIYFGSSHVVYFRESTSSYEVTSRSLPTTTTVLGDGTTSTTTNDVSAIEASNDSDLTSNHYTDFHYGLTWWPKENIQIDMKNVYRLDYWRDFELSFTLHF